MAILLSKKGTVGLTETIISHNYETISISLFGQAHNILKLVSQAWRLWFPLYPVSCLLALETQSIILMWKHAMP